MSGERYRDAYIREHGEVGYAEKLLRNANWRRDHPEKTLEYSKKRKKTSQKGESVLFIGDVHIGSASVDIDEIKEIAKKHWYGKPIVLMGDLADLGLDRGFNWDNKIHPQEQFEEVKEIFKPLDIRAYTIGNHERRVFIRTGISPLKEIFGMPDSNELTIGGKNLYFNHGISAAQDPFREHQRYIKWLNVDIVCLGHSHLLGKLSFMRDGKVVHLCRTGSFLKPAPYTIAAGYDPKIRGWVEYNLAEDLVHLKAINEETGEIFEI